jgi:hypothetical protein
MKKTLAVSSWLVLAGFALSAVPAFAQSGSEYRRSAVMRGNLIKTVFGNWGVVGQPSEKGTRGAWIYDNNGYIGDVSPLVGAEVTAGDRTFHSVEVCPIDRPTQSHELAPSGKYWGLEPVAGYFNESQEGIALFSDPASWPALWPDKMGQAQDPGWSGSWNGFFGKTTTASEECYYVMDDNNDQEFNAAQNNRWGVAFKPDANNPMRNGLGLKVKVRGMQWRDFLAQDCIFWLYEITNTRTTDYAKVVFGMLVGTYVGVTSTEDYHEYDDDYSFFDVAQNITYTGDFGGSVSRNPYWTGRENIVGYAFLESPGNMYNGIDDDGDANINPKAPATAPFFFEADFQERPIQAGDKVVLIDKQYHRTIVTVPGRDTTFTTLGARVFVSPGVTKLVEGNVVIKDGKEQLGANAYDGADNDLDGLIDENYYLHYHQIRKDQKGTILIDKYNPLRHKDYVAGAGLGDLLIDERRDDGLDNDGDWNSEFDDVGADGVAATSDWGEGDGVPTAGEPNFDQTDVDESDQIGLTSFQYFTPSNNFSMADDEDLWGRLAPGFFSVPSSIVKNKPERGEDGDFLYGSGYFPLRAGETQRFSLALVYGEGGGPQMDLVDLLKNRETVQKIYNSDYRVPPAPDKPTLTAVPGDGKVTLYWDRRAEKSFDPVLKSYDFEGYKIYRATDQNFNDVFKITNADGIPIAYKPLVQFDMNNGVKGYFRPGNELFQTASGSSFNLGNDTGLKHSFVDTDVENGRRYYYAVVAYDRGDADKDIFPKENDMRIDLLSTGEVKTFQNTAAVVPNGQAAGYVPPEGSVQVDPVSAVGTGALYYKVVDEQALTGHSYRVEFLDTSNDGVDNDGDWKIARDDVGSDGVAGTSDADGTEGNRLPDNGEPNVDSRDPDEYFVPVTTAYSVRDLTGVTEHFVAKDTLNVNLSNANLIAETAVVKDRYGSQIESSKFILDPVKGRIRGKADRNLLYGETYSIFYQYHPVHRSQNIEKSPWGDESLDTDIFDGLTLAFDNDWKVVLDTLKSGWSDPSRAYDYNFNIIDTYFGAEHLLGLQHPGDYRIEFADGIADTSLEMQKYFVKPVPVNFRIRNVTDGKNVEFIYNDTDRNGKLSPYDELVLVERGRNDEILFTWDITFTSLKDTVYDYHSGDALTLSAQKPFRGGDLFAFATPVPEIDAGAAQQEMDRIRVVPNPYVVATTHESPLPPAVTSGRGERKIDFIHLPAGSIVHLFTSRGEHVVSLEHDGAIWDGTLSWNLKSKENLDVAAGIYFYVVDSSAGKKTGKIAVIK